MTNKRDGTLVYDGPATGKHPISARSSSSRSVLLTALALGLIASVAAVGQTNALRNLDEPASGKVNPVLEWNQIFIDTLIATNTANSSSQRTTRAHHWSRVTKPARKPSRSSRACKRVIAGR